MSGRVRSQIVTSRRRCSSRRSSRRSSGHSSRCSVALGPNRRRCARTLLAVVTAAVKPAIGGKKARESFSLDVKHEKTSSHCLLLLKIQSQTNIEHELIGNMDTIIL